MGLRRLWAQCLVRAIAQVVWANNDVSWSELQMLPKCTLCRPRRAGKAHKSRRIAWTRGRLQRWLGGESSELWNELPQYSRPKPKQHSPEALMMQRQERCISLTAEGGYSNACKALNAPSPLGYTTEVTNQLFDKHHPTAQSVDMNFFRRASI